MNIAYNLGDQVYVNELWYDDDYHYNVIATIEGIRIDRHGVKYGISVAVGSKVPYQFYVNEGDIRGKVE